MSLFANTPEPPYYAVIFTSTRHESADDGYGQTANRMMELAAQQPGFLGAESAREELGIAVSYWKSLAAISSWKANTEHIEAQKTGKEFWYQNYKDRIAKVERDYEF